MLSVVGANRSNINLSATSGYFHQDLKTDSTDQLPGAQHSSVKQSQRPAGRLRAESLNYCMLEVY